jgi:predicted metalloendopeptidase
MNRTNQRMMTIHHILWNDCMWIIATHERLVEVDWLDEATRTKAIEKWAYIKANVAYDIDWDTFSDVKLNGQLFHDTAAAAAHRQARLALDVLNQAVNRNHFPLGTDVMVQNAYYYPSMRPPPFLPLL